MRGYEEEGAGPMAKLGSWEGQAGCGDAGMRGGAGEAAAVGGAGEAAAVGGAEKEEEQRRRPGRSSGAVRGGAEYETRGMCGFR